jgi:hypothetical protein
MRFLLDLPGIFPAGRFTAGRQLILRAVGARFEFQLYQPSGFFAPFTLLLLQVSEAIRICHDIEQSFHKVFTSRRDCGDGRYARRLFNGQKHFAVRQQRALCAGRTADHTQAGNLGNPGLQAEAETGSIGERSAGCYGGSCSRSHATSAGFDSGSAGADCGSAATAAPSSAGFAIVGGAGRCSQGS